MARKYQAWLGLGGNVGDVRSALEAALQTFHATGHSDVTSVSGVYRTPPWGDTDQDFFLNAAAGVATDLEPLSLLDFAKALEVRLMRRKTRRWGPRTIDIDLIAVDGVEMASDRLELPHPRATERAFVLLPMNDIAPALVLKGRTVAEWLAICDTTGMELLKEAPFWKPRA